MTPRRAGPAVRGGSLALLAATLFGVSTPLVQQSGVGLGAFSTAALPSWPRRHLAWGIGTTTVITTTLTSRCPTVRTGTRIIMR